MGFSCSDLRVCILPFLAVDQIPYHPYAPSASGSSFQALAVLARSVVYFRQIWESMGESRETSLQWAQSSSPASPPPAAGAPQCGNPGAGPGPSPSRWLQRSGPRPESGGTADPELRAAAGVRDPSRAGSLRCEWTDPAADGVVRVRAPRVPSGSAVHRGSGSECAQPRRPARRGRSPDRG